jgi:hypothetical protein
LPCPIPVLSVNQPDPPPPVGLLHQNLYIH